MTSPAQKQLRAQISGKSDDTILALMSGTAGGVEGVLDNTVAGMAGALDPEAAQDCVVGYEIESGDGTGETWNTVGVDENIIAASWHALEEAVTYCLLRSGREPS